MLVWIDRRRSLLFGYRLCIKSQGWNPEKRVVTIHITDSEPKDMVAAKYLGGIIKVVESMGSHVIVCQSHKRKFPV